MLENNQGNYIKVKAYFSENISSYVEKYISATPGTKSLEYILAVPPVPNEKVIVSAKSVKATRFRDKTTPIAAGTTNLIVPLTQKRDSQSHLNFYYPAFTRSRCQ